MKSSSLCALLLAAVAHALPKPQIDSEQTTNVSIPSNASYALPMFDPNPSARAAEIQQNRAGYLYGPSLIGNSSFFLTGSLGEQLVQNDIALWEKDAAPVNAAIQADSVSVVEGLTGDVSY